MAHVIVNEGHGPRPHELGAARTTIGATPDCDVVLTGPGTGGSQFVLEATARGHKVVVLTGDVRLNEAPCDVAELAHKDTLRVGESMVLYKNPEAAAVGPVAAAVGPAGLAEPPALEDLEDLEELEELEELEALEELQDPDEAASRPEPEERAEPEDPRPGNARDDDAPHEWQDAEEISGVRARNEIEDLGDLGDCSIDDEAADEADNAAQEPDDARAPRDVDGPDGDRDRSARAAPAPTRPASTRPSPRTAAPATAPAPDPPRGPVRFTRPLPPGCKAPTSPPPPHPGRPPA